MPRRAATASVKRRAKASPAPRPRVTRSAGVPVVPLEAVAALFIERQWLDRPRGRPLTAAALAGFAEATGGIQIDSINVLDRAHALTIWSRFGTYERAALDALLYREHAVVEYWAHAACFIARADVRFWRRAMLDYRMRHTGWSGLRKNARVIEEVETAIRTSGPLGNAHFEHRRPRGESGWWSWKPATHALHWLWMSGRTMVADRVHFQKRFDLAERVLPELDTLEPPARPEFLRWHLTRSLAAMGAATEADLRLYLTFPRMTTTERRDTLRAALRDGEVVEVGVEGSPARWLLLGRDLAALQKAGRRKAASEGTTLLAPFDSLLWHRDRVRRLFGFDYRIEVYTPGHKRVHGYYSLPIFHDGRLIGRLDAKNHRADRTLEIHALHLEPWFARDGKAPCADWGALDRDRALDGIGEAIAALATHLGAERAALRRVTPARYAVPLRKALRARMATAQEV